MNSGRNKNILLKHQRGNIMDTETQRKINFVLISTCRTSHLTFHLFVRATREKDLRWPMPKKARLGFVLDYFFLHQKEIFPFLEPKKRKKTTSRGRKKINFSLWSKIKGKNKYKQKKKHINEANKGDDSICFVSWHRGQSRRGETTRKKKELFNSQEERWWLKRNRFSISISMIRKVKLRGLWWLDHFTTVRSSLHLNHDLLKLAFDLFHFWTFHGQIFIHSKAPLEWIKRC